MVELIKFLKENNIDYYLIEDIFQLQLYPEKPISTYKMLTLLDILDYHFKDVTFSIPFTYGNPFLLIEWKGLK